MDIRTGPVRKDGFRPDEVVDCEFSPSKPTGTSKKFNCTLSDGSVVKVRYGADNGEVEGTVLATRLLWALGFGADDVSSPRSLPWLLEDPWTKTPKTHDTHEFPIATIELKPRGHEVHGRRTAGAGRAQPRRRHAGRRTPTSTRR
jgi:hypothetical protein